MKFCLLQDGHCFRDGILNLCKNVRKIEINHFQMESGSFETLIKLADEGLGTTLLPYLHTLDLKEADKVKLRHFKEPKPAREVSLIYPKSELKIHIIDALPKHNCRSDKRSYCFSECSNYKSDSKEIKKRNRFRVPFFIYCEFTISKHCFNSGFSIVKFNNHSRNCSIS